MGLQDVVHQLREPNVAQRYFSADERTQLASEGKAESDGKFPIVDRSSLQAAIGLSGHGDATTNRAHIRKRARELGMEDEIPESWTVTQMVRVDGTVPTLRDGRTIHIPFSYDPPIAQDVPSTEDAGLQPEVGKRNPQQVGKRKLVVHDDQETLKGQVCPKCGSPLEKTHADQPDGTDQDYVCATCAKGVKQEAIVVQMDPAKRYVLTVVQTPDVWVTPATMPDCELTYPKETIQQMAWDFVKGYHNGDIGARHDEVVQGKIVSPKGKNAIMCESYCAPSDLTFTTPQGVKTVVQGSWLMGLIINDDSLWKAIEANEIRASSLASTDVEFEDVN